MSLQHQKDNIVFRIDSCIKALIFDLDGTLVDSNPAHLEAWTRACRKFGIEYPRDKFYYFAGLPSTKIAEEIIRMYHKEDMVSPIVLADRKEYEFDHLQNTIKPVFSVLSIIRYYSGKLPLALGTGRRRSSTLATLDHLDLRQYFDIIVTADDVCRHKPKPDTFLECARLLHVKPEECMVFEDAERGFHAAKNAGMQITDVRPWLPPMQL